MSMFKEVSIVPNQGGSSERIVLAAATPNNSTLTIENGYYLVTVDSLTFIRVGPAVGTVTAAVNVDQVLLANNSYRVGPMSAGQKFGFISTAGGNVYLTPQA
jgi:hypothetical protein